MSPGLPLSAQLSQVLVQFTRDFEREGEGTWPVPSLVLWSNLLRPLGEDEVSVVDLPKRARLSRRAIATWLKSRWLEAVPGPSGRGEKQVRLSDDGRKVMQAWASLIPRVEAGWQKRFGKKRVGELRSVLEDLVSRLDLELPHYPTGYGAVDDSVTGGDHRPAKEGPPYIPARGTDWSPVVRSDGDTVSDLPLYALVSQALVQYAIDYERFHAGSLPLLCNTLRVAKDKPEPLEEFPEVSRVSGLHRHGVVTIERVPTKDDPARQLVELTPLGRKARDAYPRIVGEVEAMWDERYGTELVERLRGALAPIVDKLDDGLPHYPKVRFVPGLGFTEVSDGAPISFS